MSILYMLRYLYHVGTVGAFVCPIQTVTGGGRFVIPKSLFYFIYSFAYHKDVSVFTINEFFYQNIESVTISD
jgi:hypothetical protein